MNRICDKIGHLLTADLSSQRIRSNDAVCDHSISVVPCDMSFDAATKISI